MKNPITFLKPNEFKVFKAIEVIGPEGYNFTGYIPYQRKLTETYNSKTPDLLDDTILQAVTELYPNSRLAMNKDIYFEGEIDDWMKITNGVVHIDFTIRFTPLITWANIETLTGTELTEYQPIFKLNVFLNPGNEKINYIRNYAIAYFPLDQMKAFGKLLNSINFGF